MLSKPPFGVFWTHHSTNTCKQHRKLVWLALHLGLWKEAELLAVFYCPSSPSAVSFTKLGEISGRFSIVICKCNMYMVMLMCLDGSYLLQWVRSSWIQKWLVKRFWSGQTAKIVIWAASGIRAYEKGSLNDKLPSGGMKRTVWWSYSLQQKPQIKPWWFQLLECWKLIDLLLKYWLTNLWLQNKFR